MIGIKRGSTFARQEDHGYVINPREPDHYRQLCRELGQRREKPDGFVYLWSITGRAGNEPKEAAGNSAAVDFYQLLWLVQAANHEKFDQSLQLTVVSDGMQEVTGQEEQQPHKAALLGPIKVVPQEYSHIRCRSIDILLPEPDTRDEAKLSDLLTAELTTPIEDTVIAFRNRIRWVQDYEPLKLEEEIKERRSKLKQGGVWLITGGLGGIGLALARHLAAALQARLVLTGRSEFPPQEQWQEWLSSHSPEDRISRKIQQLQEIKTLGAELLVCTADAADLEQMQQAIKQAETRFGPLNAVVHAAGELNKDTFLLVPQLGKRECERQFRPKITGLAVLEKVLEGRNLDLCLLTSSLSSVLGGLGYTAYAAANIFMDAFTRKHNRTSQQQWLSVNLDAWQAHRSPVPKPPLPGHSQAEQKVITAEQGVETLMRVMTWGEGSQVVVSASPLQIKLDQWIRLHSPHEEKGKSPGAVNRDQAAKRRERPQLTTSLVEPRNAMEQSLAALWQEFFGLDCVGINDNFFELGGDSLKAMTITSTIQKTFNTTLPIDEIFNSPTIARLAESLQNAKEDRFQGIPPLETREYYPLTPAQKRLFILQQIDPESIGYNIQLDYWRPGEPQKEKLQEAFQQLFQRHEILRTSFVMMENQPVQKVHAPDDIELAIEYHDTGNINPGAGINQEGLAGILNGFVRPFDLSQAPLLRVGIARNNMQNHLLFIDIHHIAADIVSQSLLMKELRMILAGETLPPLKIQYKDFTLWQLRPERKAEILQQEAYWLKTFSGELPVLNIPTDYPRPQQQGFAGSFIRFTIGEEETRQLRALAAAAEATLFIVLLSIYTVLLSKLSGQEDIIVGTALAGRDHPDLEKIMGMFVKTLALRNFPSGEKPFADYLKEVKEQFRQARENQDYPFEDLVEKLKIRKGTNRNPLFDALFTLQKLNRKDTAATGEGIPETFEYGVRSIQFDMILTVLERERHLEIEAEFYAKLFKKETRERYTRYFKELISTVQKDPGVRLKDLSVTRHLAAARTEIPTVDFKF